MKLLLVLIVCAMAAAAPKVHKVESFQLTGYKHEDVQNSNTLINALVRQMIAYVRHVINNGSAVFGIPPLDPLELERYHLVLPIGLINLELDLKNIYVSGIGSFVVHKSDLNLSELSFDLDISVPVLEISADEYDLVGDVYTAIPLYGEGKARFVVEGFSFQAKLFLKQSDDGGSVLIDRVVDPSFNIQSIKSGLTGVIGGGPIDDIVNVIVEEVIFDYILRFHGAISLIAATVGPSALNPILEQLDTWKYFAPLIPRS